MTDRGAGLAIPEREAKRGLGGRGARLPSKY